MPFTQDQIESLKAPLMASAVAQRTQSGRKLSYIEGWHAIAEANRIFGFEAWDRVLLELRQVQQAERKMGANKDKDGWGVSYIARVEVSVTITGDDGMRQEIRRQGVGAGHGIDADKGLAHESAAKEAETDAMKRAMMTFGNPFGLALYDKTQANVANYDRGRIETFESEIVAAKSLEQITELQHKYDADLAKLYEEDGAEYQRIGQVVRAARQQIKNDTEKAQ